MHSRLALVLTGGGARGAYQVGVLRGLGRAFPHVRFPIVTGVSAGAINAVFLAARSEGLDATSRRLAAIWRALRVEEVFETNWSWLGSNLFRWAARLGLGGGGPTVRALLDTAPLRDLLGRVLCPTSSEPSTRICGIAENLAAERLRAVAVQTVDYGTGQTCTWVQGEDIEPWNLDRRRSQNVELTLDHVMASSALPLLFPAVSLAGSWHGDGGIRLAAPLSPALHLGADRILAVSTRYERSREEIDARSIDGYPPPAHIAGQLMNAIFLDVLDQDARRLRRLDRLVRKLPEGERAGLRPVELAVLRPSEDLGRLSADFEPRLPKGFRFLTRGLGTRETRSPDFLSLLMFQGDYVRRLVEIGERDVEARLDELDRLIHD